MIYLPGEWQKCYGMNHGGVCKRPRYHRSHKKWFGTWYGEIPPKPTRDKWKGKKYGK